MCWQEILGPHKGPPGSSDIGGALASGIGSGAVGTGSVAGSVVPVAVAAGAAPSAGAGAGSVGSCRDRAGLPIMLSEYCLPMH